MNILVFLGPPGAGKGTQAKILEDRLGAKQIATGDILRANIRENTALGAEAKGYIDRGELVPDDVIIRLMDAEFAKLPANAEIILDGFPRTVPQAQALDALLRRRENPAASAILFAVDDAVLMERLTGRWTHIASGRTYHERFNPPQVTGRDDVSGEPLEQRPDDRAETITNRLAVYTQQTKPLIAYYSESQRLVRVDALGPIDVVTAKIVSAAGSQSTGAPSA